MAESNLVSVCIPTLGREDRLQRLLKLIPETAEWPHEIVVRYDEFGPGRVGCPTVLARCVEASKGEFVAFLGNDCLPQQGWLRIAMEAMAKWFPEMDGCVSFNDGYWRGELPLHWVASKKLLPMLGGHFFHTGYSHCCCDSELGERCRQANKYVWCEDARVYHDHPIQTGFKAEDIAADPVYRLAYDPAHRQADCDLLLARAKQFGFNIRENFERPRIPRRVFTVWLGDQPMPPLVEKCIASQREFTKGYEHILITNAHFPAELLDHPYVRSAMAARKWVKAVDFMKLWCLYQDGGIYMDADVELLRPWPDEFLTDKMFAGLERNNWIGNGVIGAEPRHPILKACLDRVVSEFRGDDDKNFESSVQLFTETVYALSTPRRG